MVSFSKIEFHQCVILKYQKRSQELANQMRQIHLVIKAMITADFLVEDSRVDFQVVEEVLIVSHLSIILLEENLDDLRLIKVLN